MHPLAAVPLALLAALLVTAIVTDLRSRTIANGLNLAVALLAVPWWIGCGLGPIDIAWQIALALAMLVLFGACFAIRMMGGGDVKLLVALGLWLPAPMLGAMLFWMALGGGVLTLAMLAWHRLRRAEGVPEVPYGVAIAAATFLVMANHILTTPTA